MMGLSNRIAGRVLALDVAYSGFKSLVSHIVPQVQLYNFWQQSQEKHLNNTGCVQKNFKGTKSKLLNMIEKCTDSKQKHWILKDDIMDTSHHLHKFLALGFQLLEISELLCSKFKCESFVRKQDLKDQTVVSYIDLMFSVLFTPSLG